MDILKRMGIKVKSGEALRKLKRTESEVILDGIIGYSLSGDPFGLAKDMIEWANEHSAPVVSLDTPSGVSLTDGKVYQPTVRAKATLTLALPKVGLFHEDVIYYRGDLYLADISVPPSLYENPGLKIKVGPIFAKSDILLLEKG